MTNRNYEIYKSARNLAKTDLRQAKYEYEKDLAGKIKIDNKLFWSYFRSNMKTKSSLGELEMPNGDLTSDSQEKANILNNFFVSVFEDEGTKNLPNFQDCPFTEPLHSIEITEIYIEKSNRQSQRNQIQRPDHYSSNVDKKNAKKASMIPLKIIYTKSMEEEKVPDIWKLGHISAIYKSGSRSKAENYRPISLTSVPGKITERLVRDHIFNHMTKNNFLSPEQHGFIKGSRATPSY